MKIWLSELLDNQKGRSEDGRVPRPNYEQMWQVRAYNLGRLKLVHYRSKVGHTKKWVDAGLG